jgi:hypothetical protein
MRIMLAVTVIALFALQAPVKAGSLRACEQVSVMVDGAVLPQLTKLAEPEPEPDATQLVAQFRACLRSHNICSVVYNAQHGKVLVAGEVTADLPPLYMTAEARSSVVVLVRSIPRVRNDSNQYCLVSEKLSGATSAQQWGVYGWVIAPNAGQALPLQRQVLDDKAMRDPRSLRGLAAALWFFAERMSGQPPP